MPALVRGNAVKQISKWCISRAQRKRNYEARLRMEGGRRGKTLLETQMRFFERHFRGSKARAYRRMARLMELESFRSVLRESFKRKNRRGSGISLRVEGEIQGIAKSVIAFSQKHKIGKSVAGLGRALEDAALREELVEMIADYFPHVSSGKRFAAMTDALIGEMKSMGIENPVIIDYGTGTGEYSVFMEKALRAEGFNPHVIATDRKVQLEAANKTRGTRVALAEHDLRERSYLWRYRKADVVRLGWVLPYYERERAESLIRHAMADVREGGLIVIGGGKRKGDEFAIFRKISPTRVERVA